MVRLEMRDLFEIMSIIGGSSCTCERCKDMCRRRVCWPTPEQAERIINAGFADRMMLDYWEGNQRIYIVAPASKGNEAAVSPWWPGGPCCLQGEDGLCQIHSLGLKPVEAMVAYCGDSGDKEKEAAYDELHEAVAMDWDSAKGRKVVKLWKNKVGHNSQLK
jgi:hypothetical protein